MKKFSKKILLIAILFFVATSLLMAATNATLNLKANVRGVLLHGFFEDEYSGDGIADFLLMFKEQGYWEALEIDEPVEVSHDQDVTLFDFGDPIYEKIAFYYFFTNSPISMKVDYNISHFKHDSTGYIVPWALEIDSYATLNMTLGSFGENDILESGSVHPFIVATATNPASGFSVGDFTLNALFDQDDPIVVQAPAGEYSATVIASVTTN